MGRRGFRGWAGATALAVVLAACGPSAPDDPAALAPVIAELEAAQAALADAAGDPSSVARAAFEAASEDGRLAVADPGLADAIDDAYAALDAWRAGAGSLALAAPGAPADMARRETERRRVDARDAIARAQAAFAAARDGA